MPWYKTPWPYLGVLVALLGLFYFLGQKNPAYLLGFLGIAVVYSLTVHIMVLVAAFRDSVGTGFMALCIPFYALYFVLRDDDNPTLKILYPIGVILNFAMRYIAK